MVAEFIATVFKEILPEGRGADNLSKLSASLLVLDALTEHLDPEKNNRIVN